MKWRIRKFKEGDLKPIKAITVEGFVGVSLDYSRREKLEYAVIETMESNPIGQTLYPQTGFQEIARQMHYARKL